MCAQVTEELLKGNYGEHLAAQLLSRSCLIRPVVGNTDIGVDLYCESIVDGEPFLHFWVQVKSKKSFPNKPKEISCSFETKTLNYWANQPVPVIALLVPIKWPPQKINVVHIIDITLSVLINGLDTGKKSQSLKALPALCLPVQDTEKLDAQLEQLLLHHLPMTISAMYSEKGFLYPAPKPKDEYTKYFSGHILSRCLPRIDQRIKHAATFGIVQFIDAGGDVNALPESLVSVLVSMKDQNHHYVLEARGVLKQALGNIEEAKASFLAAIECIEKDPNINAQAPPWNEGVERLRRRISAIQGGT